MSSPEPAVCAAVEKRLRKQRKLSLEDEAHLESCMTCSRLEAALGLTDDLLSPLVLKPGITVHVALACRLLQSWQKLIEIISQGEPGENGGAATREALDVLFGVIVEIQEKGADKVLEKLPYILFFLTLGTEEKGEATFAKWKKALEARRRIQG